jgi:hypothetical protein
MLQPYGDNFVPVVPTVDPIEHSDERRFCADITCPCHENPFLINAVYEEVVAGLLTPEEALRTILGRQV